MTAAFAAIPAFLALAASPASTGVGIQAGAVCLPVTAQPGGSYALPPVTVQDTGSGTETIGLRVQNHGPASLPGHPVPAGWVKFGAPVSLGSGATGTVTARLTVPASARHGSYTAWVIASRTGSGTPRQASLGAEAIANLEFTVTRPGHASRHVQCVTSGGGSHEAADAASVTPAGPSPKTVLLAVIGGVILAGLYRLIFGRRHAS